MFGVNRYGNFVNGVDGVFVGVNTEFFNAPEFSNSSSYDQQFSSVVIHKSQMPSIDFMCNSLVDMLIRSDKKAKYRKLANKFNVWPCPLRGVDALVRIYEDYGKLKETIKTIENCDIYKEHKDLILNNLRTRLGTTEYSLLQVYRINSSIMCEFIKNKVFKPGFYRKLRAALKDLNRITRIHKINTDKYIKTINKTLENYKVLEGCSYGENK